MARIHCCPFPECDRTYKTKNCLKRHVTSMRHAIGDKSHPPNDPIFKLFERPVHYTRPRNLTAEQKLERARQRHKRHDAKRAPRRRAHIHLENQVDVQAERKENERQQDTPEPRITPQPNFYVAGALEIFSEWDKLKGAPT